MARCDCDQSFEVHPLGYHAVTCSIWGRRLPETIRSHAKPWFRDRTVEQHLQGIQFMRNASHLIWARLPRGLS